MTHSVATSTAAANFTLGLLQEQANSMIEMAKRYRAEMEALPPNDPQRAVYEKTIRELLARAKLISGNVITTANST